MVFIFISKSKNLLCQWKNRVNPLLPFSIWAASYLSQPPVSPKEHQHPKSDLVTSEVTQWMTLFPLPIKP
jgi:hypothetical protein